MNSLSDKRGAECSLFFLLLYYNNYVEFYIIHAQKCELFPLWKLLCLNCVEYKHGSAKVTLVVVSKSATTNAVKMPKNKEKTRLIFSF